MDIKEFAEKFIKADHEAWRKGNFDPLQAMEDPNVVIRIPPFPDMVGWEAHKQLIQGTVRVVSGLQQEFKYLAGDGNLFALTYKSSGRLTSELPCFTVPKGKEYSTDYLCLFQLKGGKIVEAWSRGSTTGLD